METLSIRMYNEKSDPGEYRVMLERAVASEGKGSPFFRKLDGLVDPARDPWRAFSGVAAQAVRERIDHLRRRIRNGMKDC
jgi:hypothetical protein